MAAEKVVEEGILGLLKSGEPILIATGVALVVLVAIIWRQHFIYKTIINPEIDREQHQAAFASVRKMLEQHSWGERYFVLLNKLMSTVTVWIGDHHAFPDSMKTCSTLVESWTVQSFEFCLKLAFLYPILALLLAWLFVGDGGVGGLNVLPSEAKLHHRLLFFAGLGGVTILTIRGVYVSGWKKIVLLGAAILLSIIGLSYGGELSLTVGLFVSFFIVILFVKSPSRDVIFALPVMALSTALVQSTIGFTINDVLALYVSAQVFLIVIAMREKHKLSSFWVITFCMYFFVAFWLLSKVTIDISSSMILFYVLLPLTNATIDWLSLGVTRHLLQSIRVGSHQWFTALLWGVLDLVIAIFFLLLIIATTISVIALANHVAVTPLINFETFFTELETESWLENFWVYFLILSTLIPTTIHFMLAFTALILAPSEPWRLELLNNFETNNIQARKVHTYLTLFPAFAVALPVFVMGVLVAGIVEYNTWIGASLLSFAQWWVVVMETALAGV